MTIEQATLSGSAARATVTRPDVGPLKVMGVLNATPDSFWSGSRFDATAQAIIAGEGMLVSGTWAVEVGGESTRPGADSVSADEGWTMWARSSPHSPNGSRSSRPSRLGVDALRSPKATC
ncbi:dihydropteroate synthase [Saccharopolyspora phatthalungensis]|uniref:Pterin-binding domain-containing protein n=1 Tax=Saccharopolyspora phatthalungensis TaxID=664693 RepID=A0A840PX08_9PSEU|nr:dihydropteroate synthase [Saccharopolyspora phatthalungensis]MBB5152846.1 hypothetical protein [Saccharopolyspora phatthalungensis]